MNKKIRELSKLLSALTIFNNVSQIPYNILADSSVSKSDGNTGSGTIAQLSTLKTLQDAGVISAAELNKNMNLLIAAQRANNLKNIYDTIALYEKGKYGSVDIKNVSDNNKNSEDNIKALEDIIVNIGVVSLVSQAKTSLSKSEVEIKAEAEQSVSEMLRLSLLDTENMSETVSAIIINDGGTVTAENSFMSEKANKLIDSVKVSLINFSKVDDVSTNNEKFEKADDNYEKISEAVSEFSKSVSYQVIAEQVIKNTQESVKETKSDVKSEVKSETESLPVISSEPIVFSSSSRSVESVAANVIAPYLEQKDISDIKEVDKEIVNDSVKKITDQIAVKLQETDKNIDNLSVEKIQEGLAVMLQEFEVKLEESKIAHEKEETDQLINEFTGSTLSENSIDVSSDKAVLKEQINNNSEKVEILKNILKSYESKTIVDSAVLEKLKDNRSKKVSELETKLQGCEDKKADLEEEIESRSEEIRVLQTQLQSNVDNDVTSRSALEEEIQSRSEVISELKTQLLNYEEEKAVLEEQINTNSEKAKRLGDLIESYKGKEIVNSTALEEEIERRSEETNKLATQLQDCEEKKAALKEEIDSNSEKVKVLENLTESYKGKRVVDDTVLGEEVERHLEETSKLETKLQDCEDKKANLEKEIERHLEETNKLATQLKSNVGDNVASKAALQEKIQSYSEAVRGLQTQISNCEKEEVDLKEQINNNSATVKILGDLRESYKDKEIVDNTVLEEEIKSCSEEINKLETRMKNYDEEKVNLEEQINNNSATVKELQTKLQSNEEDRKVIGSAVIEELKDDHLMEASELQTKLQNYEEQKVILEEEIKSRLEEINKLRTQLQSNEGDDVTSRSALEEKIQSYSKEIDELETRLKTCEKEKADLEKRINQHTETIENLEDQIKNYKENSDTIEKIKEQYAGELDELNKKLEEYENNSPVNIDAEGLKEQLKERLDELQNQIKSYDGKEAVDTSTLEEYKEAKKNYDNLLEKYQQLLGSSDTLKKGVLSNTIEIAIDTLKCTKYDVVKKNEKGYEVISDGKATTETANLRRALEDLLTKIQEYEKYKDKKFDVINASAVTPDKILNFYLDEGREKERECFKNLIQAQIKYNTAVEGAVKARINAATQELLGSSYISPDKIKSTVEDIFKEKRDEISKTEFYRATMKDLTTNAMTSEKNLTDILKDVENDINVAKKLIAEANISKNRKNVKSLNDIKNVLNDLSSFTTTDKKNIDSVDKLNSVETKKYTDKIKANNEVTLNYYEAMLIDDSLDNKSKADIANKYITAKKQKEVVDKYDEYSKLKSEVYNLDYTEKKYMDWLDSVSDNVYKKLTKSNLPKKTQKEYETNFLNLFNNEDSLEKYAKNFTNKATIKDLCKQIAEIQGKIYTKNKRLEALKNSIKASEDKVTSNIVLQEDNLKNISDDELTEKFIDNVVIPIIMLDSVTTSTKHSRNVRSAQIENLIKNLRTYGSGKYFLTRMLLRFDNDVKKISEHIFENRYFQNKFSSLFVADNNKRKELFETYLKKFVDDAASLTDAEIDTYFSRTVFANRSTFWAKNNQAYINSAITNFEIAVPIENEDKESVKQILAVTSLSEGEKQNKLAEVKDTVTNDGKYNEILSLFSESKATTAPSTGMAPPPPPGGIPTAPALPGMAPPTAPALPGVVPPPPPPPGLKNLKSSANSSVNLNNLSEIAKEISELQSRYPTLTGKTTQIYLKVAPLFDEKSPQVLMSKIEELVDVESSNLKPVIIPNEKTSNKKTQQVDYPNLYEEYKSKLGDKQDKVKLDIENLKEIYQELKKYQDIYKNKVETESSWNLGNKETQIDQYIQEIKLILNSSEYIKSMETLVKDINEMISNNLEGDKIFIKEEHNNKYKELADNKKEEVKNIVKKLDEIRKKYLNIRDSDFDTTELNQDLSDGENNIKLLKETLMGSMTVKEARKKINDLLKIIDNMPVVTRSKYESQKNNLISMSSDISKLSTDKITLDQFATIEKLEIELKDISGRQEVTKVISDLITVKKAKEEVEQLLSLIEKGVGDQIANTKMTLNNLKSDLNSKKDEDNITQDQLMIINLAKENSKKFLNEQENNQELNELKKEYDELDRLYKSSLGPIASKYKAVYKNEENTNVEIEMLFLQRLSSNIRIKIAANKSWIERVKQNQLSMGVNEVRQSISEIKEDIETLEAVSPPAGEFRTVEDLDMLLKEEVIIFLLQKSGLIEISIIQKIAEIIAKIAPDDTELLRKIFEIASNIDKDELWFNPKVIPEFAAIIKKTTTNEVEQEKVAGSNNLDNHDGSDVNNSDVSDVSDVNNSDDSDVSDDSDNHDVNNSDGSDDSDSGISTDNELISNDSSKEGQLQDLMYIKNEINKFLFNFTKVNYSNNLITSLRLRKQEDIKEITQKISEMESAFASGDMSSIVKCAKEAVAYKLSYDINYIPYYVASKSCQKFFDVNYQSNLGEDDLKKVVIISYLYSKYALDDKFDATKTNKTSDVYSIITNLSNKLYTDGVVDSASFFDSVINLYSDDGSVYMNEDEIGKLDLAAKFLRISETDPSDNKTDIERQIHEILKMPILESEASIESWQKSYQEIEKSVSQVLDQTISE